MNLDPRQYLVPARVMAEGADRNIAIELAVDPDEEVERELRSHALGIVVGGDQAIDRLHAVHSDQKLRARPKQRAELTEDVGRAARYEIADGRAWEEAELRKILDPAGQGEWPREIGDDRDDFDRRKARLKVACALLEIIAGDVDRDISGWRDSLEQDRRLGRGARAEFDDDGALRHASSHIRHDVVEDPGFGPGRIIGWQPGDLIEQLRPAMIVEPARGNRRNRRAEPREHIVTESHCLRVKRLEQVEAP